MVYVAFRKALRQIMSTTNPVEAVHQIVRKPIVGKEAWTPGQALAKQLYVSLMHNLSRGGDG